MRFYGFLGTRRHDNHYKHVVNDGPRLPTISVKIYNFLFANSPVFFNYSEREVIFKLV